MDTKNKLNEYISNILGYKLEDKDAQIQFVSKMGEIAYFIETSDVPAHARGSIVNNIKNPLLFEKGLQIGNDGYDLFNLSYYQQDISRQLAAVVRRWENHDEGKCS